jgi:predicted nucleic acid-binding protein
MINIILDTNIWITFVAKDNTARLIEELRTKVNKNEIALLTNEIIVDEWKRNKAQTINDVSNSIKAKYNTVRTLADFLGDAEKRKFLDVTEVLFQNEQARNTYATNRVEETEQLLLSCTMTPITEAMKIEVVEWALDKRAPFKKKNNSVADAIILLSSVEYCKERTVGLIDSIFVSFNHEDFSSAKDKDVIDEDLQSLLSEAQMTFSRNIGEALKLAPQLIEEITEYMNYLEDKYIDMQTDIAMGK